MSWTRPTTLEAFWHVPWPRVIAHRGFSGRAPENTRVAFEQAIAAAADMLELDVGLSRDGELVVIHDGTLDRTTDGAGPVSDHDLAALRRLDAGSWFGGEFAGETIPTLDEVLADCRGRILVNVEIKAGAPAAEIAPSVAACIRRHGMELEVLVSSFNPEALDELRRTAPEIRRASLYYRGLHRGLLPSQVTKQVQAHAFHIEDSELDDAMLRDAATVGLPVAVYTVNRKRRMRHWIDRGVCALFTDRPDRMVEWVRP